MDVVLGVGLVGVVMAGFLVILGHRARVVRQVQVVSGAGLAYDRRAEAQAGRVTPIDSPGKHRLTLLDCNSRLASLDNSRRAPNGLESVLRDGLGVAHRPINGHGPDVLPISVRGHGDRGRRPAADDANGRLLTDAAVRDLVA